VKIGIYCTGSNPVPPKNYGGVQAVNHMTAEKLVEFGHEVYLFAPPGSKTKGTLIEIYEGWGEGNEWSNFETFLRPNIDKIDILIDTTAFGLPGKRFQDLPYLYRLGGDTNKRYCQYADRNMVFPSKSHLAFHSMEDCSCGIRRAQMKCETPVVYKPVSFPGEVEDIPFADNTNEGYFLFLGTMHEHKGPHFAVEFARRTNSRLRLVGPMGNEGYFNNRIKPYLDDKITHEPPVNFENKWDVMKGAIAMLFTSDCEEGGPNAPLESLLTGTPVIAFNRSTITEYVDDGVTGLLCKSVDEMCDRIGELKRLDPLQCRRRVLHKFSLEKYINEYLNLMKKAINGGRWI
jgi:glycosyltransferase involved in cell wall biosynthesis